MQADIERALTPLIGLPLFAAGRASNMLSLQFGDADAERGAWTLQVFCAWRLVRDSHIVTGSGDLYTPADPDEDLETFDFDAPGATWWDVRMSAFLGDLPEPPRVLAARGDALGGVRLELLDDAMLEIYPHSSRAEHFETEYWRLLHPGTDDAHVVVGTFGVDRVPAG